MVDYLVIPRIIDFLYTIEFLWLFEKMTCVLSSKRENQMLVAIGTFLNHIHVEL